MEKNEGDDEQVTSQMLLVCCWRTIKEISLLFSRLGDISIRFIVNENQYRFLSIQQVRPAIDSNVAYLDSVEVHLICQYFMEQLLKSRHCGAYELAYAGFVPICEQLWK